MHCVTIKPQNRKSLAMKVSPTGVEVFIPAQLEPEGQKVQSFIDAGLEKLAPPAPPADTLSKEAILDLVHQWADHLAVSINRVQLRPMRRKWGSISTAGTLTLTDDLLNVPAHLVEYVICHELLHLKVPHHNRLYYLLLDQHLPDWRQREKELGRWVRSEPQRRMKKP
jgi:hypothetical protein